MMGPDDEPAERDVAGMGRTFPHRISGIDALHSTPFLNDVVADFAMRAVDAEGLGRDTVPDLLGISFPPTTASDTPTGRKATRSWTPPSGWTALSSGCSAFSTTRSA